MGTAGELTARQRFSLDHMLQRYTEIYREMID